MSEEKYLKDSIEAIEEIVSKLDKDFEEKFDRLADELGNDTHFGKLDEMGVEKAFVNNISCMHRWSSNLAKEKKDLKRLERMCKRIFSLIFEDFRLNRLDLALKSKMDIELFVERDSRYVRCATLADQQREVVEYIERALDTFKSKSFALRDIIRNREYFNA